MPEQQGHLVAVEDRRTKVSELYVQGYSQRKIAAILGIALCTVNADIKAIREEWQQERVDNFEHRRELETRRTVLVMNEAWQAWEKSKGVISTTKAKRVTGRATNPDNPLPDLTTAEKTEKESHGDVRYLERYCWAIERICELWGLDAPKRTEISGPEGGPMTLAMLLQRVGENPPPPPAELPTHYDNVFDVESFLAEYKSTHGIGGALPEAQSPAVQTERIDEQSGPRLKLVDEAEDSEPELGSED